MKDMSTNEHTEYALKRAFVCLWELGTGEIDNNDATDVLVLLEREIRGWDRDWLKCSFKRTVKMNLYEDSLGEEGVGMSGCLLSGKAPNCSSIKRGVVKHSFAIRLMKLASVMAVSRSSSR